MTLRRLIILLCLTLVVIVGVNYTQSPCARRALRPNLQERLRSRMPLYASMEGLNRWTERCSSALTTPARDSDSGERGPRGEEGTSTL